MTEDLSISAIIPLYNGEKYIAQAIRSVERQIVKPIELIVVDDGSTDRGCEIVRELAKSVALTLIHKPNGGQSSARNLGVRHSKGKLIALLDQDDMWYPNHLQELVKPFQKPRSPELGWVYSDLDEADENGKMLTRRFLRTLPAPHPKRDMFSCLRQDMFVLPSASLISRKAFDHVGGFDERLSGYEDDDLFLRLFHEGYDNEFIPMALSMWRIYPSSSSYSSRMAASRMVYARKLCQSFPDDPARTRYCLVRDLIAPRFFVQVLGEFVRAAKRGDWSRAEKTLEDLEFLADRLSSVRRRVFAVLHPLMRVRALVQLALGVHWLLEPIVRRLAGPRAATERGR
jgi:glycosyltransferase involved in cell wall biosynthesis